MPKKRPRNAEQARLLNLIETLSPEQQRHLLSYAEFMAASSTGIERVQEPDLPREPVAIPRPAEETVVAAIRRLAATFPMLDRDPLLHETSALMSAHIMQGRPAAQVIDELEILFRRHYERVGPDGGERCG